MSLSRRVARLCLPIFLAGCAVAIAGPSVFGDLHWRLLGPFRGGRVLTVAGVSGQPQHFYFGAVNGGVWETHDAGRTWQPIFDDAPVGSIGALAVAPSDPNVLYVGTGEADMRSDIAQGDGMYRSDDAGRHWTKIGLADSQQIGRVIVDPRDANTVFVAALGHPYGPNPERGVYRSHDGGAHWTRVLGKGEDTGAIDLAFEPGDPRVVYASMWQARRTPWNVYPPASGPGSGLYKSTDGGDSWTQVRGNGFPEGHVGRIGIAIGDSAPSRVYAIVDGDAGGLYRSDDAGVHWHLASGDPRIWQRGWYFGRITVDPHNADRVYAMNTIVLRSDDGGAHFVALKGDGTGDDFHELWIDPADSDRQILGVDQGALVTLNGGKTWSSWHNQPTAQMYHVSTDNRFPYRVYGAQQDSGAVALPSATTGAALISMEQFKEVTAGGESGMIAPDPDDPDIVYGGGVEKLDLRTDQTHSVDPTLTEPDEIHRRTWTLPLVFSKRDPKVLYYGNQKLFRTGDGGRHWTPISPDMTRANPAIPRNLDAVTAANNLGHGPRRGVIYSIAPSPLDAKLLWIGTDDGLVWRTTDEGGHWNNVTPPAIDDWSKVGMLEASHFDRDVAYAAIDRHRLEDRKPYVYRTRDGGRHWQAIVAGMRDGDFVNAVREDPVRRGLLYAATELGVYVSFDDGDHWQPMQMNLPRTSVRDLEVHGDDLVIATHGRGFWVLDDIAPLRQMSGAPADATRLFAPSTAIRVHPPGFTGTPLPKEEPTADNPPFGARIDYVIARSSTSPVTLSILDAAGQLVRAYSSAAAPAKHDQATAGTAPEWFETPSTLATGAGLHRFIWPLRYAALPPLAGGDAYADGAWALPGQYTVTLTVDGRTYTQPLTVAPDPRVHLTPDAYTRQFAFAREVEGTQAQLAIAQSQANRLHAAIRELSKPTAAALPTALSAPLAALDAKIVALAGLQESPNPYNAWSAGAPGTHSFAFLAQGLGRIAQSASDADADPSPDARSGYAVMTPIVAGALDQWQRLLDTDLAAVNAQLRLAGRAALRRDGGPAP